MQFHIFGFKIATTPVHDLASVLPNGPEAISLIPEALDCAQKLAFRTSKAIGVDLLTLSAPFLLPRGCRYIVDKWFENRNAFKQTIFIDALHTLGKSFEDVWIDKFSKHARNRTRKAEKEGVRVEEVRSFEDWISDMYMCNMSSFYRQSRYPRYPHSNKDAFLLYLDWHKRLLQENYRIYGAFLSNHLIAYMVSLEFNKVIVMTLFMSLSDFLRKCPNDALLSYLIDHACRDKFEWICYSFGRSSFSSERPTLHFSLRRFKFEHGFREQPMKIYSLGLTRAGRLLQQLLSIYNQVFILSLSSPHFITDALQKIYERRKYRKAKYRSIESRLQQGQQLP
jgi:hypothetical protein